VETSASAVVLAASSPVVLETTPSTVVSVPAAAETAAATAASASVALFVVCVVRLRRGGGHCRDEGTGRLALKPSAEFLFEIAACEKWLLSLPGGGVDAEYVIDEADQLLHSEGVVFQFGKAKIRGKQEAMDSFKGKIPRHDDSGEPAQGAHGVLQGVHLCYLFHVFADRNGAVVVRQCEFSGRSGGGAEVFRAELLQAEVL
jgi:hypothetical protein